MELNQTGPAIDLLKVASQRNGASSEVFLRLGQAQLLAGDVSEARLTLIQAKQSYPDQLVFDSLLAELPNQNPRVASTKSTFR